MNACWIVAVMASFASAQEPPVVAPGAPSAPPKNPLGNRYIEIYDIRDLLPSNRGQRFFPPEISGSSPIPVPPDELDDAAKADAARTAKADEQCRALLEAFVRRLVVKGDEQLTVEAMPSGALVVKSVTANHDQISDTLVAIRSDRAAMIEIEMQLVALDPAQRAELMKAGSANSGEQAAVADSFLPDVEAVQNFVTAHPSIVVKSPKVVVAPLRPFEVSLAEQISYVSGYETVAIEGLGTIADPVVKTLREGLVVEGMAIAGAPQLDGSGPFGLRVSLRTTVMKRPIATAKTDLGTIQMPELRHADVTTTLAGSSASSAIVGGIPIPSFDEKDDGRRYYVVVTVKLLRRPR